MHTGFEGIAYSAVTMDEITDLGVFDSAYGLRRYVLTNYPHLVPLLPRSFRVTFQNGKVEVFTITPEDAEHILGKKA